MTHKYDFFISYAETDTAWVHGYLKTSLENAGKRIFTVEDFRLGHPELLEIERAVQESHRILLVLSPEYLNNSEHIGSILDSLAQYRGKTASEWPVIPLLLRDVSLPPRLDFLVGLDFSDDKSRHVYLKRLLNSTEVPVDDPELKPISPYPGLRAYKESESNYFFGCDQAIQDLIVRLRNYPLVTIVGASGSGKSSLVYAGLIPQLHKTSMFAAKDWSIKIMRPGLNAINALKELLPHNFFNDPELGVKKLSEDSNTQNLLFFIDQFEEVFNQSDDTSKAFFAAIELLNSLPNVYIVMTLRADFFHLLMETPIFSLVEKNQYNLLPLSEEDLKDVLRKPAIRSGVFIDDLLIEKIIKDAAGEPGILPFIQETMNLLWDKLQYRYLPAEVYDELKLWSKDGSTVIAVGLKAAIALHAEASYNGLNKDSRRIAQQVFIQLVQFGVGRSDIRRQQTFADLCPDNYLAEFSTVIHYFANDRHRLLTLSGDIEGGRNSRKVDLAHESLLGAWPRFKTWIEDSKESEKTRRRLITKAKEWVELNKKSGFLGKPELKIINQWLFDRPSIYLNKITSEYLKSSQQRVQQRMFKYTAYAMLLIILPISVYFILPYFNEYQRQQERTKFMQEAIELSGDMVLLKPKKIRLGRAKGGDFTPSWTIPSWKNYKIEKFEVTNQQFCLCIKAEACSPLADLQPCTLKKKRPVVEISLRSADQYCKWLGRRLPHEAEYEYAARGLDDMLSAAHGRNKLNIGSGKVQAVGSNKSDITASGIHDLLANVSEWTLSSHIESYPITDENWCITNSLPKNIAVVRGGSFFHTKNKYLSNIRQAASVTDREEIIGFRCVKDIESSIN